VDAVISKATYTAATKDGCSIIYVLFNKINLWKKLQFLQSTDN